MAKKMCFKINTYDMFEKRGLDFTWSRVFSNLKILQKVVGANLSQEVDITVDGKHACKLSQIDFDDVYKCKRLYDSLKKKGELEIGLCAEEGAFQNMGYWSFTDSMMVHELAKQYLKGIDVDIEL